MPRLRPALIALLGSLLLLTACGGGSTGVLPDVTDPGQNPIPRQPPADGGTSMTADELQLAQEVLYLVNQERQSAGLPALAWDDGAAEVAFQHSLDMDVRGFFDHMNPDGQLPWDRLDAAGIAYSSAGENIAYGYTSSTSVMNGWMNSQGHRENILRTSFTRIGVGVHVSPSNVWWTQVFYRP
jgi:uncharacterized protein YkwD